MAELVKLARKGDAEALEKEIAKGGSLDGKDKKGDTALVAALAEGEDEAALLLLQHGASASEPGAGGKTPLMAAVLGSSSDETLQALLEKKAKVNAKDASGRTALVHALESQQLAQATLLLDRGADPNIATASGVLPIHVAAQNGLVGVLAALLKHGADANAADAEGNTPLHLAAGEKHAAAVQALIAAGAKVNVASKTGSTPLHDAAQAGDAKSVQLLLGAGADVAAVCADKHSALDYALTSGAQDAVQALRSAGAVESQSFTQVAPPLADIESVGDSEIAEGAKQSTKKDTKAAAKGQSKTAKNADDDVGKVGGSSSAAVARNKSFPEGPLSFQASQEASRPVSDYLHAAIGGAVLAIVVGLVVVVYSALT